MKVLFTACLLGLLVWLTACTNEEVQRGDATYQSRQRAGGQIPWNRPQSWEGNPMGIPIGGSR